MTRETGADEAPDAEAASSASFLARRFPWKPGDAVVFKKNSHAFFKNNDEGIVVAPESDDERSYHANAGAACVLWTAPDVVQRWPEDDEDNGGLGEDLASGSGRLE